VVTGLCPVRSATELFAARPKTLFHFGTRHEIRRTPKRKTVQKLKIAWRLCFSRKPFRELCPRMRTPEKGSNGGLLNLMPRASARIQRIAQTLLHLSSTCLLYQSECSLRKRRIKKVTGGEAEGFLWARTFLWCGGIPALKTRDSGLVREDATGVLHLRGH
jgi:hypothetical protein